MSDDITNNTNRISELVTILDVTLFNYLYSAEVILICLLIIADYVRWLRYRVFANNVDIKIIMLILLFDAHTECEMKLYENDEL